MNRRTLAVQMRHTGAQIRVQKYFNNTFWEADIDVSFDNRQIFIEVYDCNNAAGMTQRSLAPTSSQRYIAGSVYLFRDDSDANNLLRAVVFNVWTGDHPSKMKVTSFTTDAIGAQFDAMWNMAQDCQSPTCDDISDELRRKITEFIVHEFVTMKGASI
jgi:hypothetical protein